MVAGTGCGAAEGKSEVVGGYGCSGETTLAKAEQRKAVACRAGGV